MHTLDSARRRLQQTVKRNSEFANPRRISFALTAAPKQLARTSRKSRTLPAHLRCETRTYFPEQRNGPGCGGAMKKFGGISPGYWSTCLPASSSFVAFGPSSAAAADPAWCRRPSHRGLL